MLLLQEELNSSYQKFYSYFLMVIMNISFNTILKFVKKGVLYPLSYYDGDWFGKNAVNSRFGCIWTGDSKEAIEKIEKSFLAELDKN